MSETARTLLAFDYGEKRIGVAVGQTLTESATPLGIINVKDLVPDWSAVNTLLKTWQPDALVVGKPLNMDGTDQLTTARAARFGNQLRARYGLPVYATDERLSTREAYQRMQGQKPAKRNADSVAAQVILEGWFAEHREKSRAHG